MSSVTYCSDDLTASTVRTVDRSTFQGWGGSEEPQAAWVQFIGQQAVIHVLFMTSSNKINIFYIDNSTHVL